MSKSTKKVSIFNFSDFSFLFFFFINREGDISLLQVDAITNTTDETLTETNSISRRIFKRAGSNLYNEIVHYHRGKQILSIREAFLIYFKLTVLFLFVSFYLGTLTLSCLGHWQFILLCIDWAECRIGDVRVTKGHNLYAKHIIHTVCPIYSDKYISASEQTLYSCYRYQIHFHTYTH